MPKWFVKKKVEPMNVIAGDTILLHYAGKDGRKETISHTIEQAATYDTLAIGQIEDELGFSAGLVGVVGREGTA